MNITLHNLIFSGIHGLTKEEKEKPQRIKTTVSVELGPTEPVEDNIQKTIDYRSIKKVVQKVVEGPQCLLIETIAEKILNEVAEFPKVTNTTVTVSKIDIWENGYPEVTLNRRGV